MDKIIIKDRNRENSYRVYDASCISETTLCELTHEDCCGGKYTCSIDSIDEDYRDDYEEGNHVNVKVVDDIIIERDDYKETTYEEVDEEDHSFILHCLEEKPDVLEIVKYPEFTEVSIVDNDYFEVYQRNNKIESLLSDE